YWQVRNHEFINYDDDDYVTHNSHVRSGWTWQGLSWALRSKLHGHWHPVTWLSHMTDCQFFGVNPGPHHLSSVFIHILNTLLLFLILFAIHPAHVESVAWVADRKDILSTLFWMLAMWAYLRYVDRPRFRRYLLVVVAFVLGLMAKPMVVTLPLVLLVMDYWPLGRLKFWPSKGNRRPNNQESLNPGEQRVSARRLVGEKLLLLVFAGVFILVTMSARQRTFGTENIERQYEGGRLPAVLELVPERQQIARPIGNYITYIHKMLWPHDLATPYPKPGNLEFWQIGGALLLLVCISLLVVWRGRRYPYLPAGWLWYLVTFLPVIGVVKMGPQMMADRYTYLPYIGLFIIIAWGAPDLLGGWRYRRLLLGIAGGLVLLCLTVCTWLQVGHWKSSKTLFQHGVNVTNGNWLAHNNLGSVLEKEGRLEEAAHHYSEALRAWPELEEILVNIGIVRMKQGKIDEAFEHFSRAIRGKPKFVEAHINMGTALATQGRIDEALESYSEALRLSPDSLAAHKNLGMLLAKQGKVDEAMAHYSEMLRIRPGYAEAHFHIGVALAGQSRVDEAMKHFSEALRIEPDYAEAHNNLGVILEGQGQFDKAMSHYSEALRIDSDNAGAHFNLSVALDRQGQVKEAIRHLSEVVRIQPESARAHKKLGIALSKQGQIKEAVGHFSEALRIRPDDAEAHNKLGIALVRQGRGNEAISHFSEAIEIRPGYAGAHNNLGAALAKQGRFNQAISHYSEALKIKPDDPAVHENLGDALAKQGRIEEATMHFDEAIKIKRNSEKSP
ncbi:MAG: tetratricopeptide repeat protein, partial [Deltaproteobacteria bacterium]|nr:tetratricopeptide repeat protein [Deltaproteobacteria bacterium]